MSLFKFFDAIIPVQNPAIQVTQAYIFLLLSASNILSLRPSGIDSIARRGSQDIISCPYHLKTSAISMNNPTVNAVHTTALVHASNLHFSQNHSLQIKYMSANTLPYIHRFTAVFISHASSLRNLELFIAACTKSCVQGSSEVIFSIFGTLSATLTRAVETSGAIHKFFPTTAASQTRAAFIPKFQATRIFVGIQDPIDQTVFHKSCSCSTQVVEFIILIYSL